MNKMEIPIQLKKLQPFWGEWVIESHIGNGAYGDVYRIIRKRGPQEYKALKWIQIPLRSQGSETMVDSMQGEIKRRYQEQKDRLLKEVTAMEQVKENRNIVQIEEYTVYERPNAEGYDILIRMEYLTPLMQKYPIGPLEQGIVVRLGMDICAALAVCERKNMIHRDLKPGNVFIDPQGNFKLGDFGIARVLEDGQAGTTRIGTPAYMAPEMFNSFQKYDHTVDIYALSVMLYRYVNDGRLPFFHETDGAQTIIREEKAIQRRIQGETVPPARQASEELNRILLKAMSPKPADRYQHAGEMWQDLACLPVTPTDKNHVTPSIPTPKPKAKIRPWHIAAGITLTVGIAFAGFQLGVRNGNRSDSTPSTRNEENQQKQQENDVRQEETTTSEPEAYMGRIPESTPSSTPSSTPTPSPTPTPTPAPTPTLSALSARDAKYRVGNYVTFGTYPQTAEGNDSTPIEWLVLARDGNKALLISRYGLDAQPYNREDTDITWEKCTLRTWLNGTFLNKAFTAQEQEGILVTNVDNSTRQEYRGWRTSGGNNTRDKVFLRNNIRDKVFLLSYAEANKYFGVQNGATDNMKSRISPTSYARKQGAYTSSICQTTDGTDAGWWWLRSHGPDQDSAARVSDIGSLSSCSVNFGFNVVRPALWVNLESDIF